MTTNVNKTKQNSLENLVENSPNRTFCRICIHYTHIHQQIQTGDVHQEQRLVFSQKCCQPREVFHNLIQL